MITVVGSANMDLIATMTALPSPGETVLARTLKILAGGKGANQAVAAARAGSQTLFVGRLGPDAYGDDLLTALTDAGVDTGYLVRDSATPTGIALINVDDEGENSIVVVPGANSNLGVHDIDSARHRIETSSVVLLQLEVPIETVQYAAEIARAAGVTVILNPAPAQPLERRLLSLVDVLVPNEDEIGLISGMGLPFDPASAARMLLQAGATTVVVTLGAQGAVLVDRQGETDVPAYRVSALDSTGAGDAFVGNLAHALDRGEPLLQAIYFATAAAAVSVQREGGQPSMPNADETNALIGRER